MRLRTSTGAEGEDFIFLCHTRKHHDKVVMLLFLFQSNIIRLTVKHFVLLLSLRYVVAMLSFRPYELVAIEMIVIY